MQPPCQSQCSPADDRTAVLGYGNANADFHVIGDHPGVHGGTETGIPFRDADRPGRLLAALDAVDLIALESTPEFDPGPTFFSYRHCCCQPDSASPTPEQYAEFDRFFDAELRAISAHVLLPVGESATRHVLEEYTAIAHRIEYDMDALHARELRGRGFLVMPIAQPRRWDDHDDALVEALEQLRARDFKQTADLGRFLPGGDPYYVR